MLLVSSGQTSSEEIQMSLYVPSSCAVEKLAMHAVSFRAFQVVEVVDAQDLVVGEVLVVLDPEKSLASD